MKSAKGELEENRIVHRPPSDPRPSNQRVFLPRVHRGGSSRASHQQVHTCNARPSTFALRSAGLRRCGRTVESEGGRAEAGDAVMGVRLHHSWMMQQMLLYKSWRAHADMERVQKIKRERKTDRRQKTRSRICRIGFFFNQESKLRG